MLRTISNQFSEFSTIPGANEIQNKSFIRNEQKKLQITPKHIIDTAFETATFGMGCFWGAESLYGATKGVLRTTVGYAGGSTISPTYKKIGDHTEVIEIDYDPSVITYHQLLDLFWNNHEYGLSTKIKRQYMSLILYHNDKQKKIAETSRDEEILKRKPEQIMTEIKPASIFYPAEDYHQKYRLQGHQDLARSLALNNSKLLQKSHVASKLNGYLVGVGGVEQFLKEADHLGLTPSQKDYVLYYVKKNEGGGLFC